jgi:hypothetical protein
MRLPESFEQFHDTIQLSTLSEERINSAWGRLHRLLTAHYGLPDRAVYIQGSYANDTAVKPADADGEYDLDIVSEHVGDNVDPATALDQLTAVLTGDTDLDKRLVPNESGRPCVRLSYADDPEGFGFHVDIVPARAIGHPLASSDTLIEVPIRGHEGWRVSDPLAYTAWCQQQGEQFLRIVRFLKRWRDVHGDGSIASIVLQVLAAQRLDTYATSDAELVVGTLTNMQQFLGASPLSPPEICNPVLNGENLADRWKLEDYTKFRIELDEAISLATEALNASDIQASHDRWQRLFGDDFPASPAKVKASRGAVPPPPPDYPDERQQAPTDERYGG